jgi:hypothetical protein
MPKRILNFWEDDRGLTLFLAFLAVYLFVFLPVARPGGILDIVSNIGLSLILAGGLLGMTRRKSVRFLIGAFIVLFLITDWLGAFRGGGMLETVDRIFTILFGTALLVVILLQVYKSGPVTGHRVRGAIAGYLLLAVIFSLIYSFIYYFNPNSFNFPTASNISKQDFFYFSVVSLTTLGFGDITPITPLARTFVMVEAFTGQLYPAILIARLVSLAVETGKKGEGP